jgi:hypothetical protein
VADGSVVAARGVTYFWRKKPHRFNSQSEPSGSSLSGRTALEVDAVPACRRCSAGRARAGPASTPRAPARRSTGTSRSSIEHGVRDRRAGVRPASLGTREDSRRTRSGFIEELVEVFELRRCLSGAPRLPRASSSGPFSPSAHLRPAHLIMDEPASPWKSTGSCAPPGRRHAARKDHDLPLSHDRAH